MKSVKVELNHTMAMAVLELLNDTLAKTWESDDDKLIMAGLAEIRNRLDKKTEAMQHKYSLKLTPVQSFALRLFYTQFINDPKSYVGNKLFRIANTVHNTYQ